MKNIEGLIKKIRQLVQEPISTIVIGVIIGVFSVLLIQYSNILSSDAQLSSRKLQAPPVPDKLLDVKVIYKDILKGSDRPEIFNNIGNLTRFLVKAGLQSAGFNTWFHKNIRATHSIYVYPVNPTFSEVHHVITRQITAEIALTAICKSYGKKIIERYYAGKATKKYGAMANQNDAMRDAMLLAVKAAVDRMTRDAEFVHCLASKAQRK